MKFIFIFYLFTIFLPCPISLVVKYMEMIGRETALNQNTQVNTMSKFYILPWNCAAFTAGIFHISLSCLKYLLDIINPSEISG